MQTFCLREKKYVQKVKKIVISMIYKHEVIIKII